MTEIQLLTVREVATLLGIEVGTLYHWVSEGRLPCVRLSARCLRFRLTDIEKWLEELAVNDDGRADR